MEECRLIYKSLSVDEIPSNEDLKSLTETSAERNKNLGISGLLILSGNQFLQVLEGPVGAVNELFIKISKDPRHHKIELINYEYITQRHFEEWNMRLVDLWDLEGKTRTFLSRKYPVKDQVIQIHHQLHVVYSLLLDAKLFCINKPWE
jgi:hypothetical protein